ncbi:hypothetical protein AVEN_81655-1 [Araneus ventricosus]|uniref:Integrase catalytic domain-containing protein n=1 Tax=Araneus ventricosus TaxID=182803 RepID=A0A4Y2H556_ARAVE|nr:hypothetical protein AVEN_81655-1 [Araneus ventricosus]
MRRYVTQCRECQRRKVITQRPLGSLISISPASMIFKRNGVDLLGRFPVSMRGNKWIVVYTDYLRRYAVTRYLPSCAVSDVANFSLKEIILKHGAPRFIITDGEQVLEAQLVTELIHLCNTTYRMIMAYHPQT